MSGERLAGASLAALNGLLLLLGVVYGFYEKIPAPWRGLVMRGATVALAAGLCVLMVMAMRPAVRRAAAPGLTLLLCLGQFTADLFFALPTRSALLLIALVWLATLGLRWRAGSTRAVSGLVACALVLFGAELWLTRGGQSGADMLPFIAHAADAYLAGADPYAADYSGIDLNPFFYLPMQWLIYVAVEALGLDLRIVNLTSAVGMVALTEWAARSISPAVRAASYPMMLSPLALPMMIAGQVWAYWLILLGGALLFAARRWLPAAALLAVAVSVRQTALVPAGALLLALAGRIRWRRWAAAATAGAAALALCIAPFAHSAAAWRMLAIDRPARALEQAHLQNNPGTQVALSNVLDHLGLARLDAVVEIMLALVTAALAYAAGRRGLRRALAVAGLGYMLTISSNPYLHRFYYMGGFLLAAIGLALPDADQPRRHTSVDETA